MRLVTPGVTTREDVRKIPAELLYTALEGGAEVYEGSTYAQLWLWTPLMVPLPVGSRSRPATALFVFSPQGVVLGAQYTNGDPGRDVHTGDLQGLRLLQTQILIAETRSEAPRELRGDPSACTVLVATPDTPQPPISDQFLSLYVDGWFMQRALGHGFYRLQLPPGRHELSCVTTPGTGGWTFAEPEGKTLPPPRPAHRVEEADILDRANEPFDCPAGAVRYFVFNDRRPGVFRAPRCTITSPAREDMELELERSLLIVVPDQALEKLRVTPSPR